MNPPKWIQMNHYQNVLVHAAENWTSQEANLQDVISWLLQRNLHHAQGSWTSCHVSPSMQENSLLRKAMTHSFSWVFSPGNTEQDFALVPQFLICKTGVVIVFQHWDVYWMSMLKCKAGDKMMGILSPSVTRVNDFKGDNLYLYICSEF